MIVYKKDKPILKRLPTAVDYYEGVQRYGGDNLYPLRLKEVIGGSYTLTACLEVLSDFLNGEGFLDQALNKIVVNDKGEYGGTLADVLKSLCDDYAAFNACWFHIGYDLNYRISSIIPLEYEYCRLGIADEMGVVHDIKYSTNWERDTRKSTQTIRVIYEYPIFNPDPNIVSQQIEECGGIENYKGQILYFSPKEFQYTRATFDAVIEHAQTQYEAGVYKVSSLQNGFMSTTIVAVPPTNSEGEKNNLVESLRKSKGTENANGILGIEIDGDFDIDKMVKVLTPANVDAQWRYTETSSKAAIMENYAMPKELVGDRSETGLFSKENMEQAYTYYNSITRNKRAIISRFISYLMKYWQTPIISDFKIKEQRYVVEEVALGAISTDPVQNQIDQVIRGLSRRELAKLYAHVNDFKSGRSTLEQTKIFLRAYKLSDAQIELFLNDNPDDDPKFEPNG